MKKIITLVLALVMSMSLFTGCGNESTSDKKDIQKKGKIVVGITDYAPMDFKDQDGNWTGFDAEFARLFAKEIGVDCEFFLIADWSKKFFELESRQIDAVWNGMTITDEAKLNSSVSEPYVINAQVVVSKTDKTLQTKDDLKGLTISVENGSAGQNAANAIDGVKVVPLQDQAAALMEVAAGTADACVIDITMAYAMTGEGTNYAGLAPSIRLTEEFYGVSFRKDSDLTAAFNAFMSKLKKDGTLQELADKYNLTLVK